VVVCFSSFGAVKNLSVVGIFAGGIPVHNIVANCSSCSDKDGDLESAPVYSLRAEYNQELQNAPITEQSNIAAMASLVSHHEG